MRVANRLVVVSLLLVTAAATTAAAQTPAARIDAERATTPAYDGVRAAPVAARRVAPVEGLTAATLARADDEGSSRSHYALVGTFIGFGLAGLVLAADPPTSGMSAAIVLPAAAVVGGLTGILVHALRY